MTTILIVCCFKHEHFAFCNYDVWYQIDTHYVTNCMITLYISNLPFFKVFCKGYLKINLVIILPQLEIICQYHTMYREDKLLYIKCNYIVTSIQGKQGIKQQKAQFLNLFKKSRFCLEKRQNKYFHSITSKSY